jgi:hypothetical protein
MTAIVGRATPSGSETRNNRMYVHTYVFVSHMSHQHTVLFPLQTHSCISPLSFNTSFPMFASHILLACVLFSVFVQRSPTRTK